MSTKRWITLITVLLVVLVASLFTIQNSGRVVDLSLDLWFVAFRLEAPQPLPYLLWSALGIGLLVGGGWGVIARASSVRRVRELEAELARASLGTAHDDWT